MFKHRMSLALVAVAVPLFGGIAYAGTQSVSSEPSPKIVATPRTDDHGGVRDSGHGSDDATIHDPSDDKGGLATATTATTSDDPATHDLGDDHGGTTVTTSDVPSGSTGSGSGSGGGTDDPATHDVGDDHGGR